MLTGDALLGGGRGRAPHGGGRGGGRSRSSALRQGSGQLFQKGITGACERSSTVFRPAVYRAKVSAASASEVNLTLPRASCR
jgi:hypothetical protein